MTIESAIATQLEPNAPIPQRRLIMTVGDKGGSGKSFFTRALAGLHLSDNTADLLLIDGDSTVGSLVKFFGDRERVEPFSVHGKVDERDRLVNDLLRRGSPLVIADMPATSLTRLREMSDDYDFVDAVHDAGYRLTLVTPVTPYDDSILDLQDTITLCDPDLTVMFDRLETAGGKEDPENVQPVKPAALVPQSR